MSAEAENTAAEEGVPISGDIRVVDTYPEAERLISSGIAAFSRSFIDTVQSQVEASNAELKFADKVNQVVSTQYAELKDNASDLETYYTQLEEHVGALKPYLAQIDELDKRITELEDAAKMLDVQSKQLEVAFADVL